MPDVTSPDNIAMWNRNDPASLVQESQTQGASIQVALAKRQRYDYVWANATARNAQTGMVQGSRGYQIDTKTEYTYDNSAWRINLSYAEYTHGTQSIPNATETNVSSFTLNAPLSSDTTFTTTSASSITFVNAGVYAVSWTLTYSAGAGTTNYGKISSDAAGVNIISIAGVVGRVATVPVPFYRTTAANQQIYFRLYQNSGVAMNATSELRIGRMG